MPTKAQSIITRMREIPVPKPTSKPATPLKAEPKVGVGFTTPPTLPQASTPIPSPVSPPATPTVLESPKASACIVVIDDVEDAVAATLPDRDAAAGTQAGAGESQEVAPKEPAQEQAPERAGLAEPDNCVLPEASAPSDGGFQKRAFEKQLYDELEKLSEEELSQLCAASRKHPDLPRVLCNELGIEEGSKEAADAVKEFGEAEPLDELVWFHSEIAEEQALQDAKAKANPPPAKTTPPPPPAETSLPPAPAKTTPPSAPAKATPPPAKITPPPAPVPEPPTPKQPAKVAFTEIPPAARPALNFQVVGNVLWP